MRIKLRSFKDSFFLLRMSTEGQTVVEYLLLLVVMVTIITSLLGYIKTKYLGDVTKCDGPANAQTLLCKINKLISPVGKEKKFQYFPFKK